MTLGPADGAPPPKYKYVPPPGYGEPAPGVQAPLSPADGAQTEPMATTSLVLGLVSLPAYFVCSVVGLPLGIAAIVLGIISLTKMARERGRYGGRAMAVAGIVTGSTGLIAVVAFFVWLMTL